MGDRLQKGVIMPCDYSKYPPNWKQIRAQILDRAGHKCEKCGVANYAVGARDRFDEWHDEKSIHSMNSDYGRHLFGEFPKIIKVVLTIAHVHDPDPQNCAPENLAAWCQRCHNQHDAQMRAGNRRKNRAALAGQTLLLTE